MTDVAYDRIGQEIKVNSLVAGPDTKTTIDVFRVKKITPKQLKLLPISKSETSYNPFKYKNHEEVICLDNIDQTTVYMLSQNT